MPQNNNHIDNWPDVPDDVATWPFYHSLHVMTADVGANDAVRLAHALARRNLLIQLKLMSNTQCKACGGYAHRARDCPTNMRLGMLSSSTNEWKRLIACARKVVNAANAERNNDIIQQPSYHSVPVSVGRKRTHAHAFQAK